jgi:prepilin-type N-terminal cleavage/methylation domain-containing protein
MPAADSCPVTGSDEGFTLVELLVVMILIAILLLVGAGFHQLARERASDAVAKSNIRVAVPAMEAYREDTGTYGGMTLAALRSAYSPGITGIEILDADVAGYCVRSTVGGRSWHKLGPSGPITTTPCA